MKARNALLISCVVAACYGLLTAHWIKWQSEAGISWYGWKPLVPPQQYHEAGYYKLPITNPHLLGYLLLTATLCYCFTRWVKTWRDE